MWFWGWSYKRGSTVLFYWVNKKITWLSPERALYSELPVVDLVAGLCFYLPATIQPKILGDNSYGSVPRGIFETMPDLASYAYYSGHIWCLFTKDNFVSILETGVSYDIAEPSKLVLQGLHH